MNITSLPLLSRNRSIFASLLMAAVATVSQTDKAAAFDLKFNNVAASAGSPTVTNDPFGFGFGNGYSSTSLRYTNVAPGVAGALGQGLDAVFTATPKGTGYSFVEHIPNFRSTTITAPTTTAAAYQDAAFIYQIAGTGTSGATGLGKGGLDYKIELFESGTNTPYTADALRFLVYDVDGEGAGTTANPRAADSTNPRQDESVRIAKGAGLVGYQVGSTAQALIESEDANSYLFSGRGNNVAETDKSGAAIFYFANVNSVNFGFEADTISPAIAGNNPVFSAIDGDLSLYGTGALTGFATRVDTSATATAVPEPFTIIGTLIGGTAAFRMRKKLKANSGV